MIPGLKSRYFKWNCRRDGCLLEQMRDQTDIFKCFSGGRMPTDVDGFIEWRDQFLFLEEKPQGGEMTVGQWIAFQKLAALGGGDIKVVCFRPAEGDDRALPDLEVQVMDGTGKPPALDEFHLMKRPEFLGQLSTWDKGKPAFLEQSRRPQLRAGR